MSHGDVQRAELTALDFDLSVLGFAQDELAKAQGNPVQDGQCDPDDILAPPDEAVTQPGDLWILGDHRLLCGDTSKPEDLDRLLGGQPIHLCNTDPPYNVKVEPRSNNAIAALLADEMFRRAQESGVYLPFYGIENYINKLVRIRRLTPYLARGSIRFKGGSPGARMLVEQLKDFPFADHDDGPDALEMAIRIAAQLLSMPADEQTSIEQVFLN